MSRVVDISKAISETAYRTYERMLLNEVKNGPIPKHVAIIMDGNRRFAQEFGFSSAVEGHIQGKRKLEEVLEWCLELGVKVLTVYAFSTENFRRREEEVNALMDLFAKSFRDAADDPRVHKYKVKIRAIGQISLLPKHVRDAIKYAEDKTKDYNEYLLNIAVAYGGREEIISAIRKIAQDVKAGKISPSDIDERMVSTYLYTGDIPDPDLILRTSGEERISNFLLWQLAYSELYFTDIYWPEFRKIDFLRAIRSYQKRQRRFGK
ncbi:MAG: di-trans,poly-cis-decaprenylcistransferase [Thermoplasmata archaeon]|nr:MAG: di-trans,poly-cis-decaprenylcistransferase [Thermoplasmata archaeon]